MRAIRTVGLLLGATLGPFGLATAFLFLTRDRTGSPVFLGWLVTLAVGTGIGALCLKRSFQGRGRPAILALIYLPLMLAALVFYSFFLNGTVLGKAW